MEKKEKIIFSQPSRFGRNTKTNTMKYLASLSMVDIYKEDSGGEAKLNILVFPNGRTLGIVYANVVERDREYVLFRASMVDRLKGKLT